MPYLRAVAALVLVVHAAACGHDDSERRERDAGTDADTDAVAGDSAVSHDANVLDAATTPSDASTHDAGSSADSGLLGEPAGLAGITVAHNVVRTNASPVPSHALPSLVWSSTVAAAAQSWADGCVYAHSANGYGENIYASTGTPTGQSVTTKWASESANYDYAANSCSGVCGHYTQVVWRESTMLGCGIRACSTNSPFDVMEYGPDWTLVVCDYSAAGNDGSRPY